MVDSKKVDLETLKASYRRLAHAMQSGVAMSMNYEPQSTQPKHLRVGVNSAMVDTATLATLLMDKGVFTEEEFYAELVEQMAVEVARYELSLSKHIGTYIKLT